jgi:hypothetical protein
MSCLALQLALLAQRQIRFLGSAEDTPVSQLNSVVAAILETTL